MQMINCYLILSLAYLDQRRKRCTPLLFGWPKMKMFARFFLLFCHFCIFDEPFGSYSNGRNAKFIFQNEKRARGRIAAAI